MKKLNKRKVRWIIKQMLNQELSVWQIAKQQKITSRHARRIMRGYYDCKNPCFRKPGRKPKLITEKEIKAVKKVHKEYGLGAVNTEKILL